MEDTLMSARFNKLQNALDPIRMSFAAERTPRSSALTDS